MLLIMKWRLEFDFFRLPVAVDSLINLQKFVVIISSFNLQKMTADIKSGEERIQRFAKKLGSLNSIDTFDSDLEAAKANVNDIRDELQVKEANKHTFKQFIDKMEKSLKTPGDSSCPTCSRSFGTQSECEEVITALKEEIERVPQKVRNLEYSF